MQWWIKLKEVLSDPISRGFVIEGLSMIILSLAVIPFVFGWKIKPTAKKVIAWGSVLLTINLAVMFFTQERSVDLYVATIFFIGAPIIWLAGYCKNNDKNFSKLMVVACAAWMLGFLEYGSVPRNYISWLSVALILIPAFHCWRDSGNEGFVRTHEEDWDVLFGAFCIFLTVTIFMPAVGWEVISVTSYAKQSQWMLPISFAFCFLAKAIPEELLFRGIAQGAIRDRWGAIPSIALSAILFGAVSFNDPAVWNFPNWHAVINMTVLGVSCGVVYHKTRSLALSALLNATVSFTWWFCFAKGGY